jgi:hypothetical protein
VTRAAAAAAVAEAAVAAVAAAATAAAATQQQEQYSIRLANSSVSLSHVYLVLTPVLQDAAVSGCEHSKYCG